MFRYIKIISIIAFSTFTLGFSQDNYSLSFDGEDDYVDLGTDHEINGDFTIQASVKITDDDSRSYNIYAKSDESYSGSGAVRGYKLVIYQGYLRFGYRQENGDDFSEIVSNTNLMSGQFYNVAVTRNNDVISLYVNGVLDATGTSNVDINFTDPVPSYLGRWWNGVTGFETNSYFEGLIDDVGIWEVALSEFQIQANIGNQPSFQMEGLFGYWNFNEGIYDLLEDVTGNGHDGLVYGALWSEDVPNGCNDPLAENYDPNATFNDGSCEYPDNGDYALSFDGVDNYVNMGDVLDQNSGFTISTWIYAEQIGQYGIVSKRVNNGSSYTGYDLVINNDLVEFGVFEFTSPGATVSANLELNAWTHYAAVYQPNTSVKLYVNGELADINTNGVPVPESISDTDGEFILGSLQTPGVWPLNGKLDKVSIWNTSFSDNQIQDLYLDGINIDQVDLAGYWKFNSGEGDILYDHSGNQNHGTIVGSIWEEVISGCTDPLAENYNFDANYEDGSCEYPDNGDYALSFDGVGDFVDINTGFFGPTTSDDVTIMMWVYPESNDGILVAQYDHLNIANSNFYIGLNSNESAYTVSGNGTNSLVFGSIVQNTWQHLSVSIENTGETKAYLNGSLVGAVDLNLSELNSDRPLNIGYNGNENSYFNGQINNLAIFNIVLTETEIQDYIVSNISDLDNNLSGDWKFNEGEGDILYDHSGNQNHGTINGAAWEEVISGCTDPLAENYDENASIDDGSCEYPDNGDYALLFDGENNDHISINIPENVVITSSEGVTIDFFFKATASINNNQDYLYDIGPYPGSNVTDHIYRMAFDDNSLITWIEGNDNSVHDFKLEYFIPDYDDELLNQWVRATTFYGNGICKLYINGVLVDEEVNNMADDGIYTIFDQSGADYFIGNVGTLNRGFPGLIDNFSIWSEEKTISEIDIALTDNNSSNQNLVSHYKFNSNDENILYDYSGNQNHGTIIGASRIETELSFNKLNVPIQYSTIQLGINAADDGDTVSVASGIYYENINFNGKNIAVIGENKESTIIDGGQNGSVVSFLGGENTNAVLSGFTITNGLAYPKGGGILVSGAGPKLEHLKILNNIADPVNQGGSGGGVMVEFSELTIMDHVLIAGNNGIQGGGLFIDHESNVEMINCTISNNSAGVGSGISALNPNSTLSMVNCLVWGNPSSVDNQFNSEVNLSIEYSLIEGLSEMFQNNGNIDINPLFIDSDDGDFALQSFSPCIDAGDPNSPQDMDGTIADIGAYAFDQNNSSGCTDSYANNYDANAISDDGSCNYLNNGNYSLRFDGVDDFVQIPDADELDGMDELTIQFYVKWDSYPFQTQERGVSLLEKWETSDANATGSYSFYTHHDADMLTFMVQTENGQSGVDILLSENMALDTWYSVSGVFDGQFSRLYINGLLMGETEIEGSIASTDFPLEIANQGNNLTTFFGGNIDHIEIWDIAFSQPEIESSMEDSLTGDEPNLVGLWNLNEGEGDILFDLSGNQNHGFIDGAIWELNALTFEESPYYGFSYSGSSGNSDYYLSNDKMTWNGALQYCLSFGGNLACINSEAENVLVSGMLNTGDFSEAGFNTSRLWIGLTDSITEGNYEWMSGEEVTYDNWAIGHPQDIYNDIDYTLTNGGESGQWLSKQNQAEYRFVMEIESVGSPITKYHVSEMGQDYYNGAELSPFATIQYAMDVAEDGDTVFVFSGTYFENINFYGKNIVVMGEERSSTIIDGNFNYSVVTFNSGENSLATLKSFTITNGGNTYAGGGIQIMDSSPSIFDLIIESNVSDSDGAGIYIAGENQSILDELIIRDNECDLGAGVYITSSLETNTSPTFTNVEVSNNSGLVQGAVHLRDWSNATFINSTIVENTTAADGGEYGDVGGVLVWNSETNATFINSIIRDNSPSNFENQGFVDMTYTNIQDGFDGEGNIDEDPLFCDIDDENYSLAENSASVGTGENGSNMGAYAVGCDPIYFAGCIDPYAENYNEFAVLDDSSCYGYPNVDDYRLSFDGVNDEVTIPLNNGDNLLNSSPATISFWYRILNTHNGNTPLVVSHEYPEDNFFQFKLDYDSQKVVFFVSDADQEIQETLYATDSVEYDIWQNATATVDGDFIKFYLNGVIQDSVENTIVYDFVSAENQLNLGFSNRIGGGSFSNLFLDELSVWDIVLEQSQIQTILNSDLMGEEPGLTNLWKFNSGIGDLLFDHSGNLSHGNINGAQWYLDPIFGCMDPLAPNYNPEANINDLSCTGYLDAGDYALSFDGQDDYIDVSESSNISPQYISVGAWVKLDNNSFDEDIVVVGKFDNIEGKSWKLSIASSAIGYNIPYFTFRNTSGGNKTVNGTTILETDTWYYIVGTFDGTNERIYVNGFLDNSQIQSNSSINTANTNITIGGNNQGTTSLMYGQIDDVFIFDFAMNEEQVSSYLETKLIGNEEGLISYWNFDAAEGEILYDRTGNIVHGSLLGPIWFERENFGCLDPYAYNFDTDVNVDDGSCFGYPEDGDQLLRFDDLDNYAIIPADSDFVIQDETFSISSWIKVPSDHNSNISCLIDGSGQGYKIFAGGHLASGQLLVQIINPNGNNMFQGPFSSLTDLRDDQWHYITIAKNQNVAKIYVDAVLEDSVMVEDQMFAGELSAIIIGNDVTLDTLESYPGYVSELEWWNTYLTESEVLDNFSNGANAVHESLMGYWKFNSGDEELFFDHSGQMNHGFVMNSNWYEEVLGCMDPYADNYNSLANLEDGSCVDYPNNGEFSLNFDGLTDKVTLSNDMMEGHHATLSAWFWASDNLNYTSDSGRPIYSQGATETQFADFALGVIASTNSLMLEMGQPYVLTDDFALEQWNHVVVSFDSGMVSTYINGQIKSEIEVLNTAIFSDLEGAYIGRRWALDRSDNNRYTWDGNLDDIAIWDTVLVTEQIEQIYVQQNILDSFELSSNVKGYWRVNSGQDTLLFDHSGAKHHGIIDGTSWSTENVLYIDEIPNITLNEDSEFGLSFSIFSFGSELINYDLVTDTSLVIAEICCDSLLTDSLTISGLNDWYGNTTVTLVADKDSLTASRNFEVEVLPINDAPIIQNIQDTLFVLEDDSINIPILIDDIDDDLLVLTAFSDTTAISLFISDDTVLTVTPDQNWNGTFMLSGIVTDTSLASDTATFVVEVLPVNDPPSMMSIQDTSFNEDASLSIAISGLDIDGDFLTFEVSESDFINSFVYADGDSLLMISEPDWYGNLDLMVFAIDPDGLRDSTSFNLTVNAVDDEPVVSGYIDDIYLYEDFQEPWSIDLNEIFTDIDGELNYLVETLDSGVVIANIEDSNLYLTSLLNGYGVTNLVVTAINPVRSFVTDTVEVTIFGINDPPEIHQLIPIEMYEDTPYEMSSLFELDSLGNIEDIDSPVEELEMIISVDYAPLQIDWDGSFSSNPIINLTEENFSGVGQLTLCITDGQFEDCASMMVNVNAVNDLPFFVGEMDAPIGLGLDCNIGLNVDDIDSESLEVSLNGVSNPSWLSVSNNTLQGIPDSLGIFSAYLALSDGDTSIIDTFELSVENFVPEIVDIYDIPNDQGGHVYIQFNGSYFDKPDTPNQLYGVMRHDAVSDDSLAWVAVMSFPAIGESQYIFDVSTLADSTIGDNAMTQFKVVASMSGGTFHSDPSEGYSIDNIAPTPPTGLMASVVGEGIEIVWDYHADEDFEYFILEKTIDPSFSIGDIEELILSDTFYIDPDYLLNQTNFYRISAVDYVGNRGEPSGFVEATILSLDPDLIPEVFALHQNYPNPFNPLTQIRYDLPEDSDVSITIFDLMGRNIKTLLKKKEAAGFRSISWDATNQNGEPVSAGMYIYLIQANTFRETKKMILLK